MVRNCRLSGTLISDGGRYLSVTYNGGFNRAISNGSNIDYIRCGNSKSYIQYGIINNEEGVGITHYFDIDNCAFILRNMGKEYKGLIEKLLNNSCTKLEILTVLSLLYDYTYIMRLPQSTSDNCGSCDIGIDEIKLQLLVSIVKMRYSIVNYFKNIFKRGGENEKI